MTKYDVFISYSHQSDQALATALQSQMQRYASPWYRARSLRVFRDDTDLSSAGGLSASIQAALQASRWFVLVASPTAATSPWVAQEVEWWLNTHGPSTILIALAGGEIAWSGRDFDWERTTALPPVLAGRFTDEPLWADLREFQSRDGGKTLVAPLGDAVAGLVAPVRGMEKAELVGEHVRHRRRTRQVVSAAVATLVVLLGIAVQQGIVATQQRDRAEAQARLATARQLASLAQSLAPTRLDLAQLFAIEAVRMDPSPQTRAALALVSSSSPHLRRFLPAGGVVSALAAAADGSTVVAGTEAGVVRRWSTGPTADGPTADGQDTLRFDRAVVGVAVSRDGSTVLASDGQQAIVWSDGSAQPLALPEGTGAEAVAVSPSGRFLAVCAVGSDLTAMLVLYDQVSGGSRSSSGCGHRLAVPSEQEIVVSSWEYWSRLSLPDLAPVETGRVGYPINNYEESIAASGDYVGYASSGVIRVWPTSPDTDFLEADIRSQYQLGNVSHPEAFAIAADARRMAVAASGTIFVVTPDGNADLGPAIVTLDGITAVNTDLLRFVGDNDHLVSASGDQVVLWDLTQYGRTAHLLPISLGRSCNACRSAWTSVAPDGRAVAVVGDSILGVSALVVDADGREEVIPTGEQTLGPAVWLDGGRLLFPTMPGGGGLILDGGRQAFDRWDGETSDFDTLVAAAVSDDGSTVTMVATTGKTVVRAAATGEVLATHAGPDHFKTSTQDRTGLASISPDGTKVVLTGILPTSDVYRQPAFVLDLATGTWREVPDGAVADVAFAGPHLLIRRPDGAIEIWDQSATRMQRTLPGGRAFVAGLAVSAAGTLVAQQLTDGSVTVTDLDTGTVVGSFQLPTTTEWVGHTGLGLSADGSTLVTVLEPEQFDNPGTAIVWDLSDAGRIERACATVGRDLTTEEWQHHVGGETPTSLACRR